MPNDIIYYFWETNPLKCLYLTDLQSKNLILGLKPNSCKIMTLFFRNLATLFSNPRFLAPKSGLVWVNSYKGELIASFEAVVCFPTGVRLCVWLFYEDQTARSLLGSEASRHCPNGPGSGHDQQRYILTEGITEDKVNFPTGTDGSTLDTGYELLTRHSLRCLTLIPTSCDFHLLRSFITFFFQASAAMHYCNHTGYVGCRLCSLYFYGLTWWHAWDRTSTDTRKGIRFNNRFCLAVLPVTSLVLFF